MTLLVLDLRPPSLGTVPAEAGLLGALHAILPNFATYLMSFLTLGIATLPFSTALLAKYSMLRTALSICWLNILYLGAVLFIS